MLKRLFSRLLILKRRISRNAFLLVSAAVLLLCMATVQAVMSPASSRSGLVDSDSTKDKSAQPIDKASDTANEAAQQQTTEGQEQTYDKKPVAPKGNYSIILSTEAITLAPGATSSDIIAKTSDGRKVGWMYNPGNSGLVINFVASPTATNGPSFKFQILSASNSAERVVDVVISTYVFGSNGSIVTELKKTIKVTIAKPLPPPPPPKTFSIGDGDLYIYPDGSGSVLYFEIIRQNGHDAPIDVSAWVGGCLLGSASVTNAYAHDNTGYVALDADMAAEFTCTVYVDASGGGHEDSADFDVEYAP